MAQGKQRQRCSEILLQRVEQNLEQCRILGTAALLDTPQDSVSVLSPSVQKIQDLFCGIDKEGNANPLGVAYVLYDKKGNSKNHVGRALLREFFQFSDRILDRKTIKG